MILDTSAYSALRLNEPSIVRLLSSNTELQLPLPVIAELKFGFLNGSQTEKNEKILANLLVQSHTSILLPTMETARIYAELAVYARRTGRALSPNDLWIAALAKEYESQLVTYDKDFAVFAELFGDGLQILSY